ncbi:MAG TPA: hypothetical protein VFB54_07920 [Burkholderiales bacterium]|nr:hypothetical protein [Burkholderiales bacterium]
MSNHVCILAIAIAAIASTAAAQPSDDANAPDRSIPAYIYLMNDRGDKVLVSTQFWRNDPKYDDRAFHRFLDVVASLEKRGFRKDPKATIESWDKPEPYVRCYVYLEDRQAGRRTRKGVTTGTRLWCSENGASELELDRSDAPRHVDNVLKRFDQYFDRASKNVHH